MKKSFLLFIISIISVSAFGQKHFDYGFFPYETEVKTLKFEILDIDFKNKILAFKHIYELLPVWYIGDEEERKPVDCNYAGMEEQPRAGVVLGIYDLGKDEYLKTFIIYESCMKKKDCYTHEYSQQQLKAAKDLFKEYNLDITKKPQSHIFKKKSEKENFLLTSGINFTSTFVNDYDNMLSKSFLYADGELIYHTSHDDNFAMASHAEILHKAAYKEGNKIIFLCKFFHTNNMEGPKSFEFHYFSPVFEIKDGKVKIVD